MYERSDSPSVRATVAYFSMEVGIDPAVPTYSGGLGVLAGDTLRAAADLSVPMVGITLLHRRGYFRQHLDADGNQTESPCELTPESVLTAMEPRATVTLEGRTVHIRAWRYPVKGHSGHVVPLYFLDTSCLRTATGTADSQLPLWRHQHYRLSRSHPRYGRRGHAPGSGFRGDALLPHE